MNYLKKRELLGNDIKTKITFDLSIILAEGRQYKSTISLDLPVGDVIEQGTTSKEITDLKEFIFKRVE